MFISVASSDLSQVEYNASENTLTIIFKTGGMYSYHRVPPSTYTELMNAGSKGRYFHAYIKNRYPYRRLR
jgi:hypothetical protein